MRGALNQQALKNFGAAGRQLNSSVESLSDFRYEGFPGESL